jgi:hypothetical protein
MDDDASGTDDADEAVPPPAGEPTVAVTALTTERSDEATATEPAVRNNDDQADLADPAGSADTTGSTDTTEAGDSAAEQAATDQATTQVAVVRGVPRYHEPDCVLIRFMPEADTQQMSIPDAKAAGCTPCAACQPAQ